VVFCSHKLPWFSMACNANGPVEFDYTLPHVGWFSGSVKSGVIPPRSQRQPLAPIIGSITTHAPKISLKALVDNLNLTMNLGMD